MTTEDYKNETMEPVISEKKIYTGKYISLKVQTVEKSSGYTQREIITHPGTLCLILLTDENKLVMNRIYRKAAETFSLEVLSRQVRASESYFDTIINEAQKNLGYEVIDLTPIYNNYASINYSTEKVYTFIAKGKKIKDVVAPFDVQILEVGFDELLDDKYSREIIDSKTVLAINYLKSNKHNF